MNAPGKQHKSIENIVLGHQENENNGDNSFPQFGGSGPPHHFGQQGFGHNNRGRGGFGGGGGGEDGGQFGNNFDGGFRGRGGRGGRGGWRGRGGPDGGFRGGPDQGFRGRGGQRGGRGGFGGQGAATGLKLASERPFLTKNDYCVAGNWNDGPVDGNSQGFENFDE